MPVCWKPAIPNIPASNIGNSQCSFVYDMALQNNSERAVH